MISPCFRTVVVGIAFYATIALAVPNVQPGVNVQDLAELSLRSDNVLDDPLGAVQVKTRLLTPAALLDPLATVAGPQDFPKTNLLPLFLEPLAAVAGLEDFLTIRLLLLLPAVALLLPAVALLQDADLLDQQKMNTLKDGSRSSTEMQTLGINSSA
ncbi:hypothetical protein ColTof4_04615 [Colletotrichum tofieldiae]|nr:hypothetical protein ColTof3_11145 [Colletotrichum tofieldiae]GKT72192.1 hypothetical protein ColTof4_04615 [Colletotrichum tofieldiae]GKT90001.1 hypothetical protein Ct61P_07851 [Colletotrichum tofieldiae]